VPTALDCLGFEVDPRLPGDSLLRDWPAERVIRSAKPPSFARIQWPIKVLGSGSARSSYDLEQDPLETRWTAGHEHHARLEAAFEAEFAERPWVHFDVGTAGKSDRRLERDLAALGYAGELAGDDGTDGGPDSDADED
jgi:hypothetical protein